MEITAKMKDQVIEWMATQEKAALNCNLSLTTEDGHLIVLECLGYINGRKALHVRDLRTLMMILGIDESEAHHVCYDSPELEFKHKYDITIGKINYYSLYRKPWSEE